MELTGKEAQEERIQEERVGTKTKEGKEGRS